MPAKCCDNPAPVQYRQCIMCPIQIQHNKGLKLQAKKAQSRHEINNDTPCSVRTSTLLLLIKNSHLQTATATED